MDEEKSKAYDQFEGDVFGDEGKSFSNSDKLILACRILAGEGHSEGLAGQISLRSEEQSCSFFTME